MPLLPPSTIVWLVIPAPFTTCEAITYSPAGMPCAARSNGVSVMLTVVPSNATPTWFVAAPVAEAVNVVVPFMGVPTVLPMHAS